MSGPVSETVAHESLATHGNIWHRADDQNQQRALVGLTWVTRCGIERPPLRASRLAVDDADVCIVCIAAERAARP